MPGMTQFIVPANNPTRGWQFPNLCACCGAAATTRLRRRLEHIEQHIGGDTTWKLTINPPYCGSCAAHVAARMREGRIAAVFGVLAGIIACITMSVLHTGASLSNPLQVIDFFFDRQKMGRFWAILFICVAVVIGFIVMALLKMMLEARGGKSLPCTESCTAGLESTLGKITFPGNKQASLAVTLTCACEPFAEAFREQNKSMLEYEQQVHATVNQTPRGDHLFGEIKAVKS